MQPQAVKFTHKNTSRPTAIVPHTISSLLMTDSHSKAYLLVDCTTLVREYSGYLLEVELTLDNKIAYQNSISSIKIFSTDLVLSQYIQLLTVKH